MPIIALLIFALDRLMKMWTYDYLRTVRDGSMPVLENILHLTYAQNEGMSFGLFSGNREVLLMISGGLCVVLLIILFFARNSAPFLRFLGWAALGAALGNLYDRLRFGFVIDMFEIRLFRFAIFNVADTVLCICAACVCLYILFGSGRTDGKTVKKSGAYRSRA